LPGIHAIFLRPAVVGSRLVLFGDGVEDEKTEVVGFLLEFEQFRKLLSRDELAVPDLGRDDENGGRDTFFEGLVNAAGGLTGGQINEVTPGHETAGAQETVQALGELGAVALPVRDEDRPGRVVAIPVGGAASVSHDSSKPGPGLRKAVVKY
jgi:hypothetical protein